MIDIGVYFTKINFKWRSATTKKNGAIPKSHMSRKITILKIK